MKVKLSIIAFVFLPLVAYAQTGLPPISDNPAFRMAEIERTLNATEATASLSILEDNPYKLSETKQTASQDINTKSILESNLGLGDANYPEAKDNAIERALHKFPIDLSIEYMPFVKGEQIFEVIDDVGRRISRLHYPHRGQMYFLNGEIRLLPRLSVGGKYGSSHFKKTNSTDSDWYYDFIPELNDMVWNESNSRTKTEVEISDLNFYYRILDLKAEAQEEEEKQEGLLDILRLDQNNSKLLIDLILGYQWERGRYGSTDLVDTVEWWTPEYVPYNGLDSFYKIYYRGPRLGVRAQGTAGKLTTRLSFAYAWLSTKAYGWWNLVNYDFEEHGRLGYGLDFQIELDYNFTPHFQGGFGFNWFMYRQERLKESGNRPGFVYDDLDIIRNADSTIYSPKVVLRYIW